MKTIKILSMAVLALVGAALTGCSKDDSSINDNPEQPTNPKNIVTLTTTISRDADDPTSRALTGEGVKTFAVGETMAVVYNNGTSTVKATSHALEAGDITNEGKSATFTFELETPNKSEDVTYIYPAAMANADGSVNYAALASQDGTLSTLSSSLDLATYSAAWNGASLPTGTLANQLAILAITLKNEAGSSEITGDITGMTLSDGTNNYSVSRSAAAGPIYVAIRPTSSAGIDITATDGTNNYTKSLTGKTYEANNGYSVSWRMAKVPPAGALAGKFTINASGDQVYFSKGNLQAVFASKGSSCTWQFAANQWDYVGNAAANNKINGNGSVSAAGTVDLFGWVGASSTWTGAAQYGISMSKAVNNTDGYGNVADEALKSDWGTLAITNGGNKANSGWRTLTDTEWQYVFKTRTVNGGTGNGKSYTLGQSVNSTLGIVIYPDNYTGSVYSGSDWASFEAVGCVFLPCAGLISPQGFFVTVTDVNERGSYYSSSPNTAEVKFACFIRITSTELTFESNSRFYGRSVRLVRDVE